MHRRLSGQDMHPDMRPGFLSGRLLVVAAAFVALSVGIASAEQADKRRNAKQQTVKPPVARQAPRVAVPQRTAPPALRAQPQVRPVAPTPNAVAPVARPPVAGRPFPAPGAPAASRGPLPPSTPNANTGSPRPGGPVANVPGAATTPNAPGRVGATTPGAATPSVLPRPNALPPPGGARTANTAPNVPGRPNAVQPSQPGRPNAALPNQPGRANAPGGLAQRQFAPRPIGPQARAQAPGFARPNPAWAAMRQRYFVPPPRSLGPPPGVGIGRTRHEIQFSGVPPRGETRYVPSEVVLQMANTVQRAQVEAVAQQLGVTVVAS